ncbi:DUF2147 domain-containing protein [Acinetobacter halotolerans]|uniref:DUF2147 domain-containing protein n=1 Tax=Acinetobacter halotolerans TaxID=1752076 RepID=A0A4Q6X749_9GAMM|nr:DUF2147 domain-containing protein [Acinetobacter halotolerans]RZF50433.1 DUF2147 domain-containing protein [Acinetobacter halotolerans]
MYKHVFMGLCIAFASTTTFAAAIEGYWKSIEERTGQQLSIIEIRKGDNGQFNGKIVYRYPNAHGISLSNCTKCPAPHTNKPLVGLEILSGFRQDPNDPNAYVDGLVLEATSGRVYKGKGVVSGEGKRLRMRGYMGVSALGRTVVWIRTNSANP